MVEMQFISVSFLKRDGGQSNDGHISVNHNTPLQLVIVIGVVVLTITLLSSLIWMCCASSRSKYRRDRFSKFFKIGNGGGQKMQSRSWNPQKPGSVYEFGDADSLDGLSLREKSDVSNDRNSRTSNRSGNNKAPILSPLSPMPMLKEDRGVNPFEDAASRNVDQNGSGAAVSAPPQAAHPPVQRGRGWQLFDGQVNQQGQDLEAGTLPPARRPSFIDRLLAHRSLSQTNAVKMHTANTIASPSPTQDAFRAANNRAVLPPLDRCVTTPALFSNSALGGQRTIPSTPAIPGSGLISAIGGAFRRVSQTHQQVTGRRKYVPSPRQLPIESDYEGTIGGRDADLPMARRADQRRPLCAESHYTPSFTNDPFAASPIAVQRSPAINAAAAVMAGKLGAGALSPCSRPNNMVASPTPLPFAPSPLGQSQPKMQEKIAGTPHHTPGMAGVGTNWPRRMSETSIIQIYKDEKGGFDDIKRQRDWQHSHDASSSRPPKKDKLQKWIASNQFAAVPPPDDVSRRGSAISFAISDRSMPSVSRQNSVTYATNAHRKRPNGPKAGPSTKSAKELQRIASLRPHFAPMTTLASWLENDGQDEHTEEITSDATVKQSKGPEMERMASRTTEAEKHSIIEKYLDRPDEGDPFDDRSQVTDYNQRGMIWEDIPSASGPPSYRTNPSRTSRKKGIAHEPSASKRETVTVTGEGGVTAEFTLVNSAADNEDEEAERRRLKSEKKMRKRMREARRAAKRAAKEAAAAGLNPELMTLPAVRAAMNELTDAINTSDSSKAREQTLRHQLLDQSDVVSAEGPPSFVEEGVKVEEKSESKVHPVAPVKWVAELLDKSPEITEAFQASILMEKLKAEQRAQEQLPEYKASSPRSKSRSKAVKPKKSNSYTRKSRRARLPVVRVLSPPESPLTSASEYPSSVDRQRRSSMPNNRSFLVESRRGSQETETTLNQHQSMIEQRGMPTKRIVSMPMMDKVESVQQQVQDPPRRQSTQRRLPLPPVKHHGAARPISAYEQVSASVWIQ
ncbi:uncharacterized protein FA14DRAFT_155814 [Meira miltonrushii]|uniref:Uncharacterized protein n=1 Tax=Meira miltonrushii TaxID=1280837 RepID=A0A316VFV2_9BASI|nr:uncharacterized protein FA14DRAFT_155814 [Meira miltonrushii]PWN36410.1 hypothetical protein FA14DRAFT_155814 [Meira miltonrushii]